MKKQIKAILTMMGGTIGVGFLAVPYSIYKFGTFYGILVISLVAAMTIIINIAYSDIVIEDKGNRQIPGYVSKYLGRIPAHIVTIIMLLGSFGILLAYGLISGSALNTLLTPLGVKLSNTFLGLCFVVVSIIIMKNGMKYIASVSSIATFGLILVVGFLITYSFFNIDIANLSKLDFNSFSLVFGVSIFAFYSAASVPVLDEIVGYNRRRYRTVIVSAILLTFAFYVLFGVIVSLNLGSSVSSQLVDAFKLNGGVISFVFSIITLLAVFTSFMVVSNSIKEVLCYDYKIPARTSVFIIFSVLIWLIALSSFDFDSILSSIGSFALALQSLSILAVWFKIRKDASSVSKILVAICGVLLIFGMII